jgi:hypothetical protein
LNIEEIRQVRREMASTFRYSGEVASPATAAKGGIGAGNPRMKAVKPQSLLQVVELLK